MKLNRAALKKACLEVAHNILWQKGPVPVEPIEALASRLFTIALEHEEFMVTFKRDPNIITRAVSYLAWAHAIPPMKDDTYWFSNMLEVLIELTCPNHIGNPRSEKFYKDLETGMRVARAGYSEWEES